jgi:hypothetical protein
VAKEEALDATAMSEECQVFCVWHSVLKPLRRLCRKNAPCRQRGRTSLLVNFLKLDSGNIDALVGVACLEVLVCVSDMTDNPQALLAEAETRLTEALAAAPNNTYAHLFMSGVLRATPEF